jgi:hypothetical protein
MTKIFVFLLLLCVVPAMEGSAKFSVPTTIKLEPYLGTGWHTG